MTKQQIKTWVDELKRHLRTMKEFNNATEDELNEAVMDAVFTGFQKGELHRYELAWVAEYLGFELNPEFMNDPHPDPIDLKKGR